MIEQLFRKAMADKGIETKDTIICDMRLHRFYIDGDKVGSKNGWYIVYPNRPVMGVLGSWKTGEKHVWCIEDDKSALSPKDRVQYSMRLKKMQRLRADELRQKQNEAAANAQRLWHSLPEQDNNHPYLQKKNVKSHGLRRGDDTLVIPLRNISGKITSLQFIKACGEKRFLSGGQKRGCFFGIGATTPTICIAEGYATAASIHQETGHCTIVAFDAYSLLAVAREIRKKHPRHKLVICADNDSHLTPNIGVEKAKEAAECVQGYLAVPPCHGDFNDYYNGGKS